MGYREWVRLIGIFIISCVVFTPSAKAAPQILAVLTTDGGVPFTCKGGICSAELSTYCLQRERPAPDAGTVYQPAAAEDFTLSVKMASGRVRNLPATEHVAFVNARGYMTITAVIEPRQLKRLGSLNATININENASLLPVPVAGDPNPLTEKEIAYVTESLRKRGQGFVDKKPRAFAARLLTRVLNAMPEEGPAMPGTNERLWYEAIGDVQTGDRGFKQAREAFEGCFSGPQSGAYGVGVRRCVEYRHDEFIRILNNDYWNAQPNS